MSDFDFNSLFGKTSSVDVYLGQSGRSKKASQGLTLPVDPGTRVQFASTLSAGLSYANPPNGGAKGTVVLTKIGKLKTTSADGRVFVAWDDGVFRDIRAEDLRLAGINHKRASTVVYRASSLGDISALFAVSKTASDELVHRATQDLWAFRKESDGYIIERLFDDTGKPLKV